MLVFRGWGLLPVGILGLLALSTLVTENERILSGVFAGGLFLDAAITWVVGRKHHARADQAKGRPAGFRRFLDQGLFDPSGKDTSSDYSLVFLRLEYWAFPLLLAGVAVVVYGMGLKS